MPRLVCLGSFTMDGVVHSDGTERPACIGGDAIHATLGARLWETRTEMVAPIGNDLPLRLSGRPLGSSLWEGRLKHAGNRLHVSL